MKFNFNVKSRRTRAILAIVLLAVYILIVLTIFVFTGASSKDDVSVSASQDLTCYSSTMYMVIQKRVDDSVSSNILVKYKKSADQIIPCVYTVQPEDFEITNEEADSFLLFTTNYLVLDIGTAPEPRTIDVYDLQTHSKVFTDSYAKPIFAQGDTVTYWEPSIETPTNGTCSELAQNQKNGLGSLIEQKVTVDLATQTKVASGEKRCVATQ